jgi:LacI family transcriptional regulator
MLATVPITVVRWDYAALGRNCAHMLLQRMQGEATGPGRRIILPAEFILRPSCAPPPETERALTLAAAGPYRRTK